jgi:hypothetical protein
VAGTTAADGLFQRSFLSSGQFQLGNRTASFSHAPVCRTAGAKASIYVKNFCDTTLELRRKTPVNFNDPSRLLADRIMVLAGVTIAD